MSTNSSIKFFLFALLVGCCTVGCGEVRTSVKGKVTFPNGEPLTVGEVRGYGDGSHIRSPIKNDGTFELYEVKPGDKVPAGKTYGISIANAIIEEPVVQRTGAAPGATPQIGGLVVPPEPTRLVASKYSAAETSGLVLEVPRSSKPIEFNIEVTK